MKRGLLPILFIVVLDAMGIGIVFPTLPSLLATLLHGQGDVARQYGFLLAAYAVTTLLASPALGVLSDRFGRRPVLLFSLAGTALDDLVMALAPSLRFLYLGRTLAGLTGANLTVANAYIADVAPEGERTKIFGRLNASFGIGFVAGPMLGGLAALYSVRAPFYAAAALNLLGAVVCSFVLPESRLPDRTHLPPVTAAQLNPFASLHFLRGVGGLRQGLYVFGTLVLVGQVPSVLWVLYAVAQFRWSPATVGLSFAAFGALHALCQILVPGPAQKRLGQRGSILAGILIESFAWVLFSLVRGTLAAFATLPLLSLGGMAEPAVQAMLTGSVDEDRQGELQGVLTAITSLLAVLGPLAVSGLYESVRRRVPGYPGMIWLLPMVLYLPCVALLWRREPAAADES